MSQRQEAGEATPTSRERVARLNCGSTRYQRCRAAFTRDGDCAAALPAAARDAAGVRDRAVPRDTAVAGAPAGPVSRPLPRPAAQSLAPEPPPPVRPALGTPWPG